MEDRCRDVLGEREDPPSYAMISVSKVSSNVGMPLFGSSIKHRDTIKLTIKRGHVRRRLNQDWYYGDERLIEVKMSYSQFAEIMTSMNVGDGIPVTLTYVKDEGRIPECPFVDKASVHLDEFRESLKKTYANTQALIGRVRELFAGKKSFNKAEQHEILCALNSISADIGTNQDFQVSQFHEQMEKTVREGKGEIESFFQSRASHYAVHKLVEAGEEAMAELPPVEIDMK